MMMLMPSRTNQAVALPGSVSAGTKRVEDLLPALLGALEELDPARAREIRLRERLLLEADELEYRKRARRLLSYLRDALDEYSPEGHRFGANPSDDSNFGWWPEPDASGEAAA